MIDARELDGRLVVRLDGGAERRPLADVAALRAVVLASAAATVVLLAESQEVPPPGAAGARLVPVTDAVKRVAPGRGAGGGAGGVEVVVGAVDRAGLRYARLPIVVGRAELLDALAAAPAPALDLARLATGVQEHDRTGG